MSTLKANNIQEATSGGATYYLNKAWVNFDGTGTVSIRDDGISAVLQIKVLLSISLPFLTTCPI